VAVDVTATVNATETMRPLRREHVQEAGGQRLQSEVGSKVGGPMAETRRVSRTSPVDNLWANRSLPKKSAPCWHGCRSERANGGWAKPPEIPTAGRRSIAMLKDVIEAERAERDQDADCARIDAATALAEQEIAALEGQHLGPHEIRREWSAIRDRTLLAIRDVRRNIAKRAHDAKDTETRIIEKLLCQESDGRVLREFSATLQEVPTRALLDYLRYLIQIGDLARIQSICVVFAGRDDRQRYNVTFDRMLSQFAFAECGVLGERVARICSSAEKADARITALFCAHWDRRSRAPTSQQPAQVEAPMIDDPDIDGARCHASRDELPKTA
jgi:hypothetical protein